MKSTRNLQILFILASLFLMSFPSSSIAMPTAPCDAASEGTLTYTQSDQKFWFCRDASTGWEESSAGGSSLGGGGSGGGSSATSFQVEYAGLTSTTYNGALGDLSGANEKCSSEFPGSRIMWATDLKHTVNEITDSTNYGIFYCDNISLNSIGRPYCNISGLTAQVGIINCFNFKYDLSMYTDGLMTYRDVQFSQTACNIANSLLVYAIGLCRLLLKAAQAEAAEAAAEAAVFQ